MSQTDYTYFGVSELNRGELPPNLWTLPFEVSGLGALQAVQGLRYFEVAGLWFRV